MVTNESRINRDMIMIKASESNFFDFERNEKRLDFTTRGGLYRFVSRTVALCIVWWAQWRSKTTHGRIAKVGGLRRLGDSGARRT